MDLSASPPRPRLSAPPAFLRSRVVALALLGVLATLGGCRDSPTDPLAGGLLAGETELAALSLELPLPAPAFDEESGEARELEDRWRSSWALPTLEGRPERNSLHGELGRHLARTRSPAELQDDLESLGAAVRRAEGLDPAALPAFLEAGIRRAGDAWAEARRAARAGDEARAWSGLLAGSDALREVGPEAVARTAVADVEAGMRRIPEDAPYSEQELERIRHLLQGSRHAVTRGEWVLAIRRAYYARMLLDGNG